jgi:hypothetical protein
MKAPGLQRPLVMPGFVKAALAARKLTEAYEARPAYQKSDYLLWIEKTPLMAGKRKRLDQMLDELEKGDVYMGEPWTPPPPVKPAG